MSENDQSVDKKDIRREPKNFENILVVVTGFGRPSDAAGMFYFLNEMELISKLHLSCPIRGLLKVSKKSKDGLMPTGESFRIEAIRYLLSLGYPNDNFLIEPVIKRFGNN